MCNVCNFVPLGNRHNRFTVAAYEADGDEVVGHIPREVSHMSALLLDRSGLNERSITVARRHSKEAG